MATITKEVTCNAVINSANIQLDRDCFLSVWLDLDYGGSGQGFGGYILGGTPDVAAGAHKQQKNLAAEFLVQCLMIGGVEKWSELRGKVIRVRRSSEGFGGDIVAIGHCIKDLWFFPKQVLGEMTKP